MAKVVDPEEQKGYTPPNHNKVINKQIISKDMGSLKMGAAMGRMAPGGLTEMHTHESAEQLHYVLEGEVTIMSPDGNFKLTKGKAVWTPAGEAHGMMNETDEDIVYLVFTT